MKEQRGRRGESLSFFAFSYGNASDIPVQKDENKKRSARYNGSFESFDAVIENAVGLHYNDGKEEVRHDGAAPRKCAAAQDGKTKRGDFHAGAGRSEKNGF